MLDRQESADKRISTLKLNLRARSHRRLLGPSVTSEQWLEETRRALGLD